MKKILLSLICIGCLVGQGYAVEDTSSGANLVAELNKIMSQYETQLKSLQAENNILRNEVAKAGIKIPLSDFSWAIGETQKPITTITGTTASGKILIRRTPVTKVTTQTTVSGEITAALNKVEKENWARYRGFIENIIPNWTAIKSAYKLKNEWIIAGYEFVKKWNDDHVFVDIAYDGAGTGVYDVKILYQYHTGTYARKLIWLFEFNRTTKYYVTKTGTNPFAGVPRTFVAQPKIGWTWTNASTSQTWVTTIVTPSNTWATTVTTWTASTLSTVTLSEIEKAYWEKRYLSVISLSNSYLSSNTATYDLLRIRYRTYFIIWKYSESLTEIEKINSLGRLDKSVACDAQVIATYSKNQTLINTYTSICKWK